MSYDNAMAKRSLLLLTLVLGAGCSPAPPTLVPPGLHSPYTGYSSAKYHSDTMWLCRPDLPGDPCHADLSATEIHPDGSRTLVPHRPAADPKIDCFYVYPTVDLHLSPGNHTDFSDLGPMRKTTLAQAARFSEVCALYVPLYRQITIGTFALGAERRERYFQTAFSDVLDAFLHYLGTYNRGRRVALIGHSQGAEMVDRLVHQLFENDPTLRERLIVAMPIGGPVEVPSGQLSGGTFKSIPLCTSPEEQACVIAFRTHREGPPVRTVVAPPTPGNETACINPADVGGTGRTHLSRTYYPVDGRTRKYLRGAEDVTTPFVLYRDYYEAICTQGPGGYRYLAIAPPADPGAGRKDPVDLENPHLNGRLGTHILDMQFPQGDLIDLVARKAAAGGR